MHTRNSREGAAARFERVAAHAVRRAVAGCAGAAGWAAGSAHASFLSGDALDTAADVLAWVVLCVVPIVAIVVFWVIHVMPEKIAHKRHHPQREGIQTLCLLSLVFGGLLWPIAWLWAYTRPVAYRMAYGTDKHEDYFLEQQERHRKGVLPPAERTALLHELDAMHARGTLPPHLAQLRNEVAAVEAAAPIAAGTKPGAA